LIDEAEGGNATARFIRGCLRRCIVYQFHNTSETARVRLGWSKDDNRYLKEDGANLAAVLLRLRDELAPYYRRIVENIRRLTPQFLDFELEPSNGKVLLQWRERDTDMVFGPHQASDGTLRIMALFTLLLQPPDSLPDVIIMDEPELGLHPYAIRTLAGLVKSVSKQTQVVLATQSANLLNCFDPEDIVVMERPERETTLRRLGEAELAEWLDRYSMAELWEKNVLGGTP
jgi:predicted ATPase